MSKIGAMLAAGVPSHASVVRTSGARIVTRYSRFLRWTAEATSWPYSVFRWLQYLDMYISGWSDIDA